MYGDLYRSLFLTRDGGLFRDRDITSRISNYLDFIGGMSLTLFDDSRATLEILTKNSKSESVRAYNVNGEKKRDIGVQVNGHKILLIVNIRGSLKGLSSRVFKR